MRVLIDPGHGGEDPGAVSGSAREADIALAVSHRLAQALLDRGHVPVLTRHLDVTTPLHARTIIERWTEPGLFVSIHCNASLDARAHGMEVWTSPGQTAADEAATRILEALTDAFPGRRVRSDWDDGDPDREARFYVLRKTRCPAVLVEMEFLTNPDGWDFLTDRATQEELAAAIADGITAWAAGGQG